MWGGYFGPHRRAWLLLLLLSSVLFLVTEKTTARRLLHSHGSQGQGQLQKLLHASLESSKLVGGERDRGSVNRDEIKELSALGSRPPSCKHKCGGCVPCLAIQVPTTMDRIELHYANYEPEGWKCKCGSTFFNP